MFGGFKALIPIFVSSNDADSIATLHRINWHDSQNLRFADQAMPLDQLVGDVNADCRERETYEEPSRLRNVDSSTVEVMTEKIAQPAIHACIEPGADGVQGQEPDSAGAGYRSQGRRYRVQPGNKFGHQQQSWTISGKDPLGPTIVHVGIPRRQAIYEVQDLVAPTATRFEPNPVSQYAGDHGGAEHGENSQLSRRGERPSGHQYHWARYGESYLAPKNHGEQK